MPFKLGPRRLSITGVCPICNSSEFSRSSKLKFKCKSCGEFVLRQVKRIKRKKNRKQDNWSALLQRSPQGGLVKFLIFCSIRQCLSANSFTLSRFKSSCIDLCAASIVCLLEILITARIVLSQCNRSIPNEDGYPSYCVASMGLPSFEIKALVPILTTSTA